MVKNVKDLDEYKKLTEEGKTVFVDFHAEWCGPCKKIGPVFKELSEKHYNDALFIAVDVDEGADIADMEDLPGMPCFVVYKNKKKVDTVTGSNESVLTDLVAKHL